MLVALAGLVSSACPVRIWCLGDSITGTPGCWRALLWRKLQADGFKNLDFVGSLSAPDCGFQYDGENDGHWGYLATEVMNGNYKRPEEGTIDSWLQVANPDVVIMHFGTNDCWNNIAPAQILQAFDFILNKIRGKNPNAYLLVAQIIPLTPSGCGDCPQRVTTFNAQVVSWAQRVNTAASPVVSVDCHTGFDGASDTSDGGHPTDSGNEKISNAWLKPVETALQTFSC
jgi:mannan endo-1,4-beta-mannosidase